MTKMNKIRVGGTFDFSYAANCFVMYPEHCKNPGTDIEYIHCIKWNVAFGCGMGEF